MTGRTGGAQSPLNQAPVNQVGDLKSALSGVSGAGPPSIGVQGDAPRSKKMKDFTGNRPFLRRARAS